MITSCARSLSPQAMEIREADDKMVTNCELIGTFQGGSGWGNLAQETGMSNSRAAVFNEAATKGATHIVMQQIHGGYTPYASGRGYRCPKQNQ